MVNAVREPEANRYRIPFRVRSDIVAGQNALIPD